MKAFQKAPKSLTASINGELPNDVELPNNVGVTQMFLLELTMEIKEDDGKVILSKFHCTTVSIHWEVFALTCAGCMNRYKSMRWLMIGQYTYMGK